MLKNWSARQRQWYALREEESALRQSQQKTWFFNVLENAPTIAFLATLEVTGGLREAGWTAAGLAVLVLLTLWRARIPMDTILIGINGYFLAITPMVELLFVLEAGIEGARALGAFLRDHAQTGVLAAILIGGAVQIIVSPRRFIGVMGAPLSPSLILLAVAALGFLWSAAFAGDRILSIALPIAALFSARHLLRARIEDKDVSLNAGPMAAPTATLGASALTDNSAMG